MKKIFSLVALGTLIGGCSFFASSPPPEGMPVTREDPPATCVNLGKIVGVPSKPGDDIDHVKEDLRAKTAALHGNYIRMEAVLFTSEGSVQQINAVAYKCP